ncbi:MULTISPECIES: hypothetical protein [Mesorhizobium]|uniref:hypothetical protein n=1 Tax=Mesorhizobium TaxID=68287 RepID=UPI0007A94E4B|nr:MULTISPECIES: hypothetical protein [Mesorhizobium]AMX93628.1 hypothetical protein A4R28_11225 [Mesorhizobium ciceri]MDF3208319.1 hypothetical protein [Mesorhizobium sp. LMG15046]MDF3229109.1 hypothetical protein [Mesorhizobium sp. DSM 30133]RUU22218.1 hypothetical protein EOC84_03665 [Mesorhizobium sp. Primo-B]RUU37872.1 hypothetical protein EOC83_16550 [Mesorhizobium sp. Primo-A]
MANYLSNVGSAFSRLLNTLIGGSSDQTLSARIGLAILGGGPASKIKFPNALREHFVDAAMWSLRGKNHD